MGMMLRISVIASLLLVTSAARGEPTDTELKQRAESLKKKLAGQGYTVLIEAPFVVVGDEAPATVAHHATGIMRWCIKKIEADYFPKRPNKLIEVWLFKNEKSFRKGAKKFFNDDPNTPYGYYSSDADALVMNIGPGAGTLTHELVHPYMEANFANVPSWFNEGLASLYERPSERKGHIVGLANWRLPNLKKEIKNGRLPNMATLMRTSRDGFYDADFDGYAYARYLLMYLQEQGKLVDFYNKFHTDTKDLTGQAALEAIVGEDLEKFEPKWRKWVLALQGDNR